MKIKDSYTIKNSYDRVERFYYHTILYLMNSVVVLDRNKANLKGVSYIKQDFIEKVNNLKDVTIDFNKFYLDSIGVKVDVFQTNLMDLQSAVAKSYY
jgi:hypothetical protein